MNVECQLLSQCHGCAIVVLLSHCSELAMTPQNRAMVLALVALVLPRSVHRKMAGSIWAISCNARVNTAWSVFCAALAWQSLRTCVMEWWQKGPHGMLALLLKQMLSLSCSLPYVRTVVDREVSKELKAIERKMHGNGDSHAVVKLPQEAWLNNVEHLVKHDQISTLFVSEWFW